MDTFAYALLLNQIRKVGHVKLFRIIDSHDSVCSEGLNHWRNGIVEPQLLKDTESLRPDGHDGSHCWKDGLVLLENHEVDPGLVENVSSSQSHEAATDNDDPKGPLRV